MAEHGEEPEATAAPALGQASPAAVALALGRASKGGKALDVDASAFLREQTELVRLQKENLHEERDLQTSLLRLGRWKARASLGLQALTGLVGLAVAGAVGAMAWQALEDHGLTIAAFSVPPELAARGLTGEVIAARVLDRLSQLQAETVSVRPASTYAENWGDDIKVEIPETGISIGELNAYLRQWLGHGTRITGEVVRTPTGLQVTARAGAEPGKTVEGAEDAIDALTAQAAEAVYAATQPYRYAVYLAGHGKPDEALATYVRLARSGSAEDRRWAYTGWSALLMLRGDNKGAAAVLREAERQGLFLHDTGGDANLGSVDNALGHRQAELNDMRGGLARDKSSKVRTIYSGPQARRTQEAVIAMLRGDARSAAAGMGMVGNIAREGGGANPLLALAAQQQIAAHDVSGGRRALDRVVLPPESSRRGFDMAAAEALDDWAGLVALAEQGQAWAQSAGPAQKDYLERSVWPALAVGYARIGRQAEAGALVAKTPPDCEPCVNARGLVAAAGRDWAGADRWFAAVVRQAPDIPLWEADWGGVLLAKGDVDGAIAKLSQANRKGPRYADPLELWGEALMKKGDFKGAVAKFKEADEHAPRWGRNHLRWGQALAKLGRTEEAKAQWRAAAGMDLSAADRADLVRMQGTAPTRTP
ncbi:MAG: hypothetical protein ABIO37_15290 [Caulobacteraceae bacterium]